LHSYDQPALNVSQSIDDYEETVFMKPLTKELLQDIYLIRRKASVCLKLLLLTKEVINKIPDVDNDPAVLQDVRDLHLKLVTLFEQAHEDTTHLLDIYLSLSSKNSNEVMKVLTIFSVFLLPPTFIVGLYGMNFQFMPELHHKYGYPIVLTVIVILTIVIYSWFKRKKWL
jgi:magnesium transporter